MRLCQVFSRFCVLALIKWLHMLNSSRFQNILFTADLVYCFGDYVVGTSVTGYVLNVIDRAADVPLPF